jgi:hypothetical protein
MKIGICTVCESRVAIVRSDIARKEERERGLDDWEIDMQYGDSINFLVMTHEFCGERCDGSQQIPQTVL